MHFVKNHTESYKHGVAILSIYFTTWEKLTVSLLSFCSVMLVLLNIFFVVIYSQVYLVFLAGELCWNEWSLKMNFLMLSHACIRFGEFFSWKNRMIDHIASETLRRYWIWFLNVTFECFLTAIEFWINRNYTRQNNTLIHADCLSRSDHSIWSKRNSKRFFANDHNDK